MDDPSREHERPSSEDGSNPAGAREGPSSEDGSNLTPAARPGEPGEPSTAADLPPPGSPDPSWRPGPDTRSYFGPSLGPAPGPATRPSHAPALRPAPGGPEGPAAPSGQPPKPRRRWPWIVLLLLALGAAGAATAVAFDQRDTAEAWRERAVAMEQQRQEALERGDVLDGQVGDLADTLSTSEQDVAMLEERIRQLADEKAQAEDAATTVQVERDVVADLTAEIAAATDALDACVDRLFELQAASVEAFNQTAAGEEVDVEPLNARARETTQFCNDARTAAARASAAAQQLTAP